MKKSFLSNFRIVIIAFTIFLLSCKKQDLPTLTTYDIKEITFNSGKGGGIIINEGGAPIMECGVCWDTIPLPTIFNFKTIDGLSTGSFNSNITGLIPGHKYNVRAYATNSYGIGYGNTTTFTTLSAYLPTIETLPASNISINAATCGGTITADGGAPIVSRGVCWSVTPNPTILNSKTIDGDGSGSFISNLTSLSGNTRYYLRAYATNIVGTNYGNEVSFIRIIIQQGQTVTDIDGNIYNSIIIGNQTWMSENLKTTKYQDGSKIPLVTQDNSWEGLNAGAYCWYNHDSTINRNVYGGLYNFYATTSSKGICPIGWHVPKYDDWMTMRTYLQPNNTLGGRLKETGTSHWVSPNTGATNETGFTALPGGYRDFKGRFYSINWSGYWWSPYDNSTYSMQTLYTGDEVLQSSGIGGTGMKTNGFSIRCIKN